MSDETITRADGEVIRMPEGYGHADNRTPGFDAVRARYGADMVTRIQNWPRIQRVYLLAQGMAEDDPTMEKLMGECRGHVERAARDKDYALQQADMVVRAGLSRADWAVVPTVDQLRRQWGLA